MELKLPTARRSKMIKAKSGGGGGIEANAQPNGYTSGLGMGMAETARGMADSVALCHTGRVGRADDLRTACRQRRSAVEDGVRGHDETANGSTSFRNLPRTAQSRMASEALSRGRLLRRCGCPLFSSRFVCLARPWRSDGLIASSLIGTVDVSVWRSLIAAC